MSILFFLLLLIVVFVVAGSVLGVLAALAWYAIVGLVIGALARLLVKDTRGYGLLATILSGIVGAVGGGLIANVLDFGGVLEFIVALLVAAVVIAITAGSAHGRRRLT